MTDEPDNLVLAMLRRLDTNVDRMGADIGRLTADMSAVKTELRVHTRTLDILLQEGRLLRAAVNDIAKENVTPGEVEAIHHDLNRLRHEMSALAVRVEELERRDRHKPHSPSMMPPSMARRSSHRMNRVRFLYPGDEEIASESHQARQTEGEAQR